MGFATPLKRLIIALEFDTIDRGRGLRMLRFPISCSLQLSNKHKQPLSLQIYSPVMKHGICACLINETLNENYAPVKKSPSSKEASFNIKFPRRNLIVQFTCNSCGERTQRKISRIAFERGTIFVQCAGCMSNHKLVDNLGLVAEYDLSEKLDTEIEGTQ